ncbi:hypothetical protein LELG_03420 [Lodderomyces elongisporus NRRL YB-4239]|uniref:Protein kinase domain-containing protein n=1 Tax=Lodderomyces elongisporus (strain ATCC 11503 / CBS 2605 / JCM 1781 / NBRC 1676 / NRRL YB-4239) TaxID=379508 RepID=A5E1D3_LODEL|nr:hypothetical protein LELG_03420 [Lodderomyces elongisporus NRRL YB-4239]
MSLLSNRKRPRGYSSENFANAKANGMTNSSSTLYQEPDHHQQLLQFQYSQQQHQLHQHQQQQHVQNGLQQDGQRYFGNQEADLLIYQSTYQPNSLYFPTLHDDSSSTIIEEDPNSDVLGPIPTYSTNLQSKKSKFNNPFLSVEEHELLIGGEGNNNANNININNDDDDDDVVVDEGDGIEEANTFVLDDDDEGRNIYDEDDDVIIIEEKDLVQKGNRNNSDSILINLDAAAAYKLFNVNAVDSNENDSNTSNSTFFTTKMAKKKQRTSSLPQLPQVKCFYNKLPNNYILQTPKLGNIKTNVIPFQNNLPPCDDENGHYIIKINDNFANRFVILKLLGQGTFGKVVECYDKVNREHVAIKIIRNIQKYRDAAKIELRILSTLKKFDNANKNHCIHLRECFDYRGHICIVTDLLKISLYDFLENNRFIPFPGSHIQAVSKQLIRSVTFLHDLNLIHTDLKPENILLHDDSFVKKALYSSTTVTAYTKIGVSNANTASSTL